MLDPAPAAWRDLARKVEDLGFSTLLAADHLGAASPFEPLVVAAGATERLRVGTLVINNDFQQPLLLAREAATVDRLTDGRLELGLGSGWNKPEFDLLGLDYDPPATRAARLHGAIRSMKQAWAGDPRVGSGERSRPAVPIPAQHPHPPIQIGGNGDAILTLVANEADIVGFTGSTWRGDRMRPTGVSAEAIEERISFVRAAAGDRADDLELSALVQRIDAGGTEGVLEELAKGGVDRAAVADSPFFLLGSRPSSRRSRRGCGSASASATGSSSSPPSTLSPRWWPSWPDADRRGAAPSRPLRRDGDGRLLPHRHGRLPHCWPRTPPAPPTAKGVVAFPSHEDLEAARAALVLRNLAISSTVRRETWWSWHFAAMPRSQ
jgi:probable F420-dependent oxidoreductase